MKFILETRSIDWSNPNWFHSSHTSAMPTNLIDIIEWLKSARFDNIRRRKSPRQYRLLVDGIPLAAFDLDNLWILESYL